MTDEIINYGMYIIAGLVMSYAFYKNRGRDFEDWDLPFGMDWNPDETWGTPFTGWASMAIICSFAFMLLTLLFLSLSGKL